jgi:aminoglycoside phosphotransferase family enzyme
MFMPDKTLVGSDIAATTGDFAEVVAFLSNPASHPGHPPVDLIETHMSLVFLAGDRVYKMKKPVRLAFVDYRTIETRRVNCERETGLNQRLAPGVYLGTLPLFRRRDGTVGWSGDGEVVEWLVAMRRLDPERLLDRVAGEGRLEPTDVDRLCDLLAHFYAETPRIGVPVAELLRWWGESVRFVEASLADPLFQLQTGQVARVAAGLRGFLAGGEALLAERLASGCILDGHGDLRPEHVHLGPPVVLIDRLEFEERLRWADPFDEAVFLGMECARLGAHWVERRLLEGLSLSLSPPPARLLAFYRCYRASLRARLSIEHLRDPHPRSPERWRPQTEAYLALALQALPGLQS